MNVVGCSLPHRRALFVLLGLLVTAGISALFTSARSIYPRVTFNRIAVIAERGEAPVRGMLIGVTRTLEQAVSAVPDLMRVRSKTVRGASELSLEFHPTAIMSDALALVRARVAAAGLPADVHVVIEQQTPAVFPVLSFNVLPGPQAAGDPVARARLTEWVELDLKARLARLPDVFTVTVQSGDRREYVFEADPIALEQDGLTLNDVKEAIAAANTVAAVGRHPAEGLQYQLLVDGQITEPRQILDIAIPRKDQGIVRLAQLGQLVEATAERTMVVTGGGRASTVVSVFLRDGGQVTMLSREVKRILQEVRDLVPAGGEIAPVYDQAILVEESIAGVRDAIALGAVLAVVVIALFLGEWRLTLVAAAAIPISVALTLAVFPLIHESLNLMSLGGLAVAIGLIIDDAIVVVENVARRIQSGGADQNGHLVVASATQEVVGAIVGSSLTTIVVFVPLVLLQGVVGQFFRSLSLALGISIVASTVVSLVYSPLMMLVPWLRPRAVTRRRRVMTWIQDRYALLLAKLLEQPLLLGATLALILLLGLVSLRGMRTGFLPEMDEGGFVVDYFLPVGTSLDETDATCRRIERALLETPEVASFSRRTGAELGFFATEQFTGDFLVGLVPQRKRSIFAVIEDLRERLAREAPQAQVEFIQVMQDTIADLSGNPAPIEVKLLGTDYPSLQRAADAVAERIAKIDGVVDVVSGVSFGSPELKWQPDPSSAARFGLSTQSIASELTTQLLGDVATVVLEHDRLVDVRVRSGRRSNAGLLDETEGPTLFLHPPGWKESPSVPLSEVARFQRQLNENELERENQTAMVRVTAQVAGRDLGSASRAVEAAVMSLPRDPSLRVELGGQSETQKAAFVNMLEVLALGVGLVFFLLVVQFRSLVLPLVMFLALPFGQVGGLCALQLTGVALNISSGMGLIMLVGLVVKNGIIMIEYAQQLHRGGQPERAAIIAAARVRLRPILMTSLAAIAGLFPLALGFGAGTELQRPLAIVVIGGLLISTVFTLLVVPLGCATLASGRLTPETADAR